MPLVKSGAVDLFRAQSRHPYNTLQDLYPHLNPSGIDLLNDLLAYDPSVRITARAALRHAYFRCSPFPRDVDLMPTFPTLHDDMMEKELKAAAKAMAGKESSSFGGGKVNKLVGVNR